jgi:hypothetical protein
MRVGADWRLVRRKRRVHDDCPRWTSVPMLNCTLRLIGGLFWMMLEIIVDSWNYRAINLWRELAKEPLGQNSVMCFKAFTVTHKLLQEGSPRVCLDDSGDMSHTHTLSHTRSLSLSLYLSLSIYLCVCAICD